jgi:hypothetical protein
MKDVALKAVSLAAAAAIAFAPIAARAQTGGAFNSKTVHMTGATSDGAPFAADFVIQRFENVNGQVVAVGTLAGATDNRANGQAIAVPVSVSKVNGKGQDREGGFGGTGALERETRAKPATWSPDQRLEIVPAQVTCSILHLTLGPLDLNLLGLLVHLNQVVLNIDAQPGGGLLGNLLCGLLNPPSITQLVALLNQILALLP